MFFGAVRGLGLPDGAERSLQTPLALGIVEARRWKPGEAGRLGISRSKVATLDQDMNRVFRPSRGYVAGLVVRSVAAD